ncbi:MAG: DUF1998 domain-containing protein [Candidatus Eremiobacteraeota bacterium]|nr:DUF1998 domain-containing protein [Candidatus Eremiobacteraeota bacterium]
MPQKRPIRRGQLITPWGIGSMINFPYDESLMVCGLDIWEFALQNCPEEMKILEERLQQRLRVDHFRLPPEYRDRGPGVKYPGLNIPCVRFPRWHYCPQCGAMEKLSIYGGRQRCKGPAFSTGRTCHDRPDRNRPYLIPSRFIAVCSGGHIEDFPFMDWVHREENFTDNCSLRLQSGRSSSSLSGIIITCSCGRSRSMAGAFNKNSLSRYINKKCSGQRPWLGEVDEEATHCDKELQVIQRGASNVYFPQVRSSIYLPVWGGDVNRRIVEVLEKNWDILTRSRENGHLNRVVFEAISRNAHVDCDALMAAAEERLQDSSSALEQAIDSEETFRKTEYDALLSEAGGENQDFFVTRINMHQYSPTISEYFNSISLVHKLRETRVLIGFSRLLPEDGNSLDEKKLFLHKNERINWLPAIAVKGEGVFFEFKPQKMETWLEIPGVKERASLLIENYNNARVNRRQFERELNPRFILLHTFAHLIINQFSYSCGYGSSALRERIYCNTENEDEIMNGVLIYTASGDSGGSLGGLVRQGKPGNLEDIIFDSLSRAKWCSSDPICMESRGQGPDSCNLAACYACTLLPETSCEEGNRLLDRGLVIGSLDDPRIGYFAGGLR